MLPSGHNILVPRWSSHVYGQVLRLCYCVAVCCVLSLGCRPEERAGQDDRSLTVYVDLPSTGPTQTDIELPAANELGAQEDAGTAERAISDTHLLETEASSSEPIVQERRAASKAQPPPVPTGPPEQLVQLGRVTVAVLNVRIEPGLQAERIGLLHRTTLIEILEEQNGWYHILAYAGRLQGWVTKRYVTALSADASSDARSSP